MAITTERQPASEEMPEYYISWVSETLFVYIRHDHPELGVGDVDLVVNENDVAGDDAFRMRAEIRELLAPWGNGDADIGGFGVDPEDSQQLLDLREAIDTHLGWANAEDEERGDYVRRIREVGLLLTGAKDEEG